ncbi:unnamed protein product, partial [Heligmosomoides polygyrus]
RPSSIARIVGSLPLITATDRPYSWRANSGAASTIRVSVRKPGLPDALFPSVCPPACSQLFHAAEATLNDSLSDRCSCVCPPAAPVYLNTAGYCVDRLGEFNHVFKSPASDVASLLRITMGRLAVFFDNMDHRWRAATRRTLFDISTAHGRPVVMFRGSETDVAILTGAVVQLKLSCTGFAPDEHCLSFRVAGVSGFSRAELLFILVLAFLLALSITGSFVIWHLCWRIKKRQLISDIQMQFLYHLQQHPKPWDFHDLRNGEFAFGSLLPLTLSVGHHLFSEYLDEAMMANPPPVAEQFLADLRRVIEVARERIKMRRFVPMLITIPEDHEEVENTDD